MDLITLLSRPEGKTLEFKRDLSSPDGALKAIVAFANTSGGVLLLGVEDSTKRVKGIPNILAEEERLANLIADSISPRLVPSIDVMPWRKTEVLAVEIYPSASRPHFLNRLGPEEGVFVRVGSTNRRADLFLIEEMRRYNQVSSFDEQPRPELNSEAIDFRVASELFAPYRHATFALRFPSAQSVRGAPGRRTLKFPCLDRRRRFSMSRRSSDSTRGQWLAILGSYLNSFNVLATVPKLHLLDRGRLHVCLESTH